ncbi:molybdate ABC transporter substrate-binding protein [Devosia nitrariae]|nr:molybdate ABC transporter substrate-binding protein [Devosia nitrariae]
MKRVVLALLSAVSPSPAHAETVTIAVAANFTALAEDLAEMFAAQTGHEPVLSFASTGQLYAQITQGAPYEVFLAADNERPRIAIEQGLAVAGTAFTYAVGRLVLYSPTLDVSAGEVVLQEPFSKLAIADPAAAPYGAAAIETLEALGLYEAIKGRLVTGENISQTLQFVETGNAELGFVAASQVVGRPHQWLVPADFHQPIRQDAVLLKAGETNPAAVAFLDFLRSGEAVALIEAAGYDVP